MRKIVRDSENYTGWKPEPIESGGLYFWPPQYKKTLHWLKANLSNPRFFLQVGILLITWFFLTPDLTRMKVLEFDWILFIYFRNVALLVMVVAPIHYWLYVKKAQGTKFKFNSKWPKIDEKKFLFQNQTKDNIFWSIVSGCSIWTLYEVLTYWMFANDHFLSPINWSVSPIYFFLLFLFVGHIHQHHFFFIHRLLHWKPLYKSAHYLHHKNINTTPWSGLSMHPIEHLLYLSAAFIFWFIPAHPLHAIYILQIASIQTVWGHCGFSKFVFKNSSINNNVYHHYLHHRYFECNYGNPNLPWDIMFGYFNDGSETSRRNTINRMKLKEG